MLTVVVTCWGGARPIYTPWHVLNCRAMLRKHLTAPHRFVCLTDNVPAMEAAGIWAVPLWPSPVVRQSHLHWLNNYARLGLLGEPGKQLGERLLGIDLDIVIRDNINSLVETDAPVKFMSLRSRWWIQGGLVLVTPGAITPDPWAALLADPTLPTRIPCVGSDQAVLTHLFGEGVRARRIPSWNEDDGIAINTYDAPWRLFFRTGHRKCWHPKAPEYVDYFREAGVDFDSVPPAPEYTRGAVILPSGLITPRRR
jgi:hypothetical protein